MIEKKKNSSNYCKYCGWEFQHDIVQKINENTEPVYCEFCGIELNITSISRREEHNKEKYERISNSNDNNEKQKKSIVKSISKLTKSRKYSIDVIFGDDEFPKIFKENLIIVISRLTYVSIREWEQDNNVSVRRVSLTKSILYEIANNLKPIIDKRISNKLLKNLHKLSIEEFEDWLKLLQKKLQLDQPYRTQFKIYLLWLIKIVFRLVSDMWDMENLPKIEATILKDLKNYFTYLNHSIKHKKISLGKVRVSSTDNKENQVNQSNLELNKKNKISSYTPLKLIEDLRKALQKILPKEELLYEKKLTDLKLSTYLGQIENHIYKIKKNCKRNPKFQLNLNLIGEYKNSLISKFGDRCKKAITLIEKYESLNDLKRENKHIYNYHPNIKLDYFKNINTKEKAYWLGFIYADGGLSYLTPKKKRIRFYFGLDIKDKDSRDKVYRLADIVGIEEKYVKPCSRGNLLQIVVINNTFALHLNKYGVIIGKRKSKNIELPELGSRALNLAFLLGYYDGDGTEGSTVITSGSKKFLEQIKKKYKINYEMRYKKSESIINDREVKGEGWDLALGAKLFNEMIRNYLFSMPKKRRIFETQEEKSERMRQTCIDRAKLKITDEFLKDLKKLVWKMPLYKIAEKHEISVSRISEICKKYNINKPQIGYWKKKQK